MIPNDATRAQILAADPEASTWLSANAGSGKTRVLTDRVARLLLRGVAPERILCLTYTKAAASEMQNRLFARLGAWSMMTEPDLRQSLAELGVGDETLSAEILRVARRLFAKAIETPGGLKIQTIHSFCASLLRRFPLEADVSPSFAEVDDRSSKVMRGEVLEQVAIEAPDVMRDFAQCFTGAEIDKLLQEICNHKGWFSETVTENALRKAIGLRSDLTEALLLENTFTGEEADLIARLLPVLQNGGTKDQELATRLAALDVGAPSMELIEALEHAFLKAKAPFDPKAFPPTKETYKAFGNDGSAFDAFRERIAEARNDRLGLQTLPRQLSLHSFAAEFLARIEAAKLRRGMLDFDDQILKARALLNDPGVAAWVLFRLDGGTDHILVDEAQDTSPEQWDIVRLLAQEFTAGQGARADTERTLFVVGDQKQSIYSFQGADPHAFDRMRAHFDSSLSALGQHLQQSELLYSFRSSPAVLKLVDATFPAERAAGFREATRHIAFKEKLPGRVDLWSWIEKTDDPDPPKWYDPVDLRQDDSHAVKLARQIAAFIDDRLQNGQITQEVHEDGVATLKTRPIEPGDFLILVQSRSRNQRLFEEIIRACKLRGLPMAGADRLKIGAELGVKDLVALLSYLATPEDDLALATVLRSPLGGFSEPELHDLAYGRPGFLRTALEQRKEEFSDIHEMLRDLRALADFLRPYDLLERALTRHGGREKLRARLGEEAEEGIAALLDQALAFERHAIPELTGFLSWLEADEVTIKRQLDARSKTIRVMTVHGAKGLEAPIVILPDTGARRDEVKQSILDAKDSDGTSMALWKSTQSSACAAEDVMTDEIKEKQREENLRLLYVAMTRAESWLIVCGAGSEDKPDKPTWYNLVKSGLDDAGASDPQDDLSALRLETGMWPADKAHLPFAETSCAAQDDWAKRRVGKPPQPLTTIAPSQLGGAKALPGIGELTDEQAMARGKALHLLLEHLPQTPRDAWSNRARALLTNYDPVDPEEDLLTLAAGLIDAPHLSELFGKNSLAEVDVTAPMPPPLEQQMLGTIDRLIVSADRVLAVDFKSNRAVPETADQIPEGILRQMGAYEAALEKIYPNHRIETAILWTETGKLQPLQHDIVRFALSRSHTS